MPVLITGAERPLGRLCTRALAGGGGQVRVYVDDSEVETGTIDGLRGLGAKVARGTSDDEGFLEAAMEQVHTVVHAAIDPLVDPDTVVDDTATVVSAALGAGVRRLILVSHLGVADPQSNPWLEAVAEAETLVADAGTERVIIRRGVTYAPHDPLTWVLSEGAPGASPDATHAPLFAADLAAAVAAADARDRAGLSALEFPLTGPEWTSLGELVALLGGQVRSAGAGTALPDGRDLPWWVADLLSRDLIADRSLPTAGTTPRAGAELVRVAEGRD